MGYLKKFFSNIIDDVLAKHVKEIKDSLFTRYKIYDEYGRLLAECDFYFKPIAGDTILADGLRYPSLLTDVEILKVKISSTGFTGRIIAKEIKAKLVTA